jgi:hypothetical protein
MLNHNQTAIVLVIGLVAVLMILASTRVFAQPTLPPNEENKVNNALQSEENKVKNLPSYDHHPPNDDHEVHIPTSPSPPGYFELF